MSNKIQIKRSVTNSTVPTLANGEFGFTGNGNVLYIGAPDGSGNIRVAGLQVPGTLTANQALVANATSGIDKIITANLTLSGVSVNTVNTSSNLTHLGNASNNELSSTYAIKHYVDLQTASASTPQGSNGQFQYNDSGVLAGTNNFTYDNTSNTITVGNSTVNVQLGYVSGGGQQLQHWHANANTYGQVQLTNSNTGPSSSADFVLNADNYTDSTNYVDLGINGSNWSNTQWTINGADDGYLYAANGTMAIGTASAKAVQFFANGTLATNEVMRIDAGANVGIGNTNPNAKLQVTGTANISGNVVIGGVTNLTGNLILGSSSVAVGLQANGSYGAAGQTLLSNGSATYWATLAASVAGSNTQIQFNDSGSLNAVAGFTFNKTSNTLSIGNTVTNSTINSTSFSGAANSATYLGGNTASDLRGYSDTKAATAYSNAVSYAGSIAATAYSNAVSYADVVSGSAYSNAMSDTLSRNGSYTGNNSFGGTNTIFTSNVAMEGALVVNNNVTIKNSNTLTVGNSTANSLLTSGRISISNSSSGNISLFSSLTDAAAYGAALVIGNPTFGGGPGGATVYAPQGTGYSTTSNLFFTNTSLLQIGNSANFVNITGANSYFNGNVSVTGNTSLTGVITAGNNMVISGHIIPSSNVTYDLGNTTNAWRSLYIKGTTIYLGTLSVQDSGGGLALTTTVGGAPAALSSVLSVTTTSNVSTIGSTGYFVSNGNFGLGNNAPADKLSVNGTTTLGGNVSITGANIDATSSTLRIRDITATGNLIVSGSVVTVNTTTLTVKDNVIEIGTDNTTTDAVDTGFFSPAGDGNKIWYSGIARIAAASSNSNPVFRVFASNTNPNTATTIDTSANTATGTLQAYLQPWGTGGAFVVNSTAVTVTANSTVAVNLTANSLVLSSALATTSGGTGLNTYTSGDLLVGNTSNALSKLGIGSDGYVLQVSSGSVTWGVLDGGTF